MKFTLSWLKTYLDTNASLAEISEKLTDIGLEVEEIIDNSDILRPFTVAEILSAEKHPDADKLQICKVRTGNDERQIVCGAPNARAGIKVVLADIGATIPNGGFKIKPAKIRGIESSGMLCSADELGLGADSAGIMELPLDADIGASIVDVLGLDDPMIEIAITPNRGDCLGVYGIARDLAAGGIGTLKQLNSKNIDADFSCDILVSDEINSHFIGRTITDVENGESPDWLKRRLESIGSTPKTALVDISNFITFDLGRPSHIYDADKLSGNLVVRKSIEGEEFISLDDIEYNLPAGINVIADDAGVQAIAGVMGGKNSAVTAETKNIFIEIANFDRIETAMAGRKLQIESDARYRFERSVDGAFLPAGMEAVTSLIQEICGGKASNLVEAGKQFASNPPIAFNPAKIRNLLGVEIEDKKSIEILSSLGFKVSSDWEIVIPSWRNDVAIEQDIVEEIARIYGYNNIPAVELPSVAQKEALSYGDKKLFGLNSLLASAGLSQVVNYSFISRNEADKFDNNSEIVEIVNPISENLSIMRPTIIPSLYKSLISNVVRSFTDIHLFENGKSYSKQGEDRVVAILRSGYIEQPSNFGKGRKADIYDIKRDAFNVINQYLDASNLQISRDVPSYYHPARSGALKMGKNIVGYFGQLHPSIAKKDKLKNDVVIAEIFIDKLPCKQPKQKFSSYNPSNLQIVERDFAFVIANDVAAGDLIRSIGAADKKNIVDVRIFDVYQDDKLKGEDKKSIALKVYLQPKQQTYTADELASISDNIIANVEKRTGGVLRS